jgi:putative hydrolase
MVIQADLHTHTLASTHAFSTITENAVVAAKMGLAAMALTDHAPLMDDAPHHWHHENYVILPRFMDGVRLLFGIEADIMNSEGKVDIPAKEMKKLDWIIASVHVSVYTPKNSEEHMAAYLNVIKNQPYVDVLGHISVGSPEFGIQLDPEKIVKSCSEFNKIIEINENHISRHKTDVELMIEMLKYCKKYGVQVCVNSDAHHCSLIGKFPVSLQLLEDFPEELVINSDIEKVLGRIKSKNLPRGIDE